MPFVTLTTGLSDTDRGLATWRSVVRFPRNGERRSRFKALLSMAAVAAALGCASTDAPVSPGASSRPSSGVRSYLLNPLLSFDLSVGSEEALQLDRGFAALVQQGDADTALRVAQNLLARNDTLAPAIVLAAQAVFVAGDYDRVVEQLNNLMVWSPDYDAALLLQARSYELLGRELRAFELYRQAGTVPVARQRADELGEGVRKGMMGALAISLEQGRLSEAQEAASKVAEYFPETTDALQASRDLAIALGDTGSELLARRNLLDRVPATQADSQRLANLEVEIGDPTQGLEILQRLAAESPDDYLLQEQLDAAKFSWRLTMLPPGVVEIVEADGVTRAQFATLLYWVVPGLRSGATRSPRIAVDVPVDHPHRREVVRVVNMGVMPMADPALRRFAPEAKIELQQALDILLRLPKELGIPSACADRYASVARRSRKATCDTAVRCGVVVDANVCLESGVVKGSEAKELVRRTLNLLGGTRPNPKGQ